MVTGFFRRIFPTLSDASVTHDKLRLIEAQLHILYGVNFVVEHDVETDMLLVSWINTHGNQQHYKLRICSLDRGFQVASKSMNGLIAMVKMTT